MSSREQSFGNHRLAATVAAIGVVAAATAIGYATPVEPTQPGVSTEKESLPTDFLFNTLPSRQLAEKIFALTTTANSAAQRTITDANDPDSLCKNVAPNHISNSEAIVASDKIKATPQIDLQYDGITHHASVIYLFDAGPNSSEAAKKLGGSVQLFYDVGPVNALSLKLAGAASQPSGQNMTPSDLLAAIASPSAKLDTVGVWSEKMDSTTTAFFNSDGSVSFEYMQGNHGAGPFVVDDLNSNKISDLTTQITTTMHNLDQVFGPK